MTFLLFVASVVVLEYLLRGVRPRSGRMPEDAELRNLAGYDSLGTAEASTADLLSLGQALNPEIAAQKPEAVADGALTKTE